MSTINDPFFHFGFVFWVLSVSSCPVITPFVGPYDFCIHRIADKIDKLAWIWICPTWNITELTVIWVKLWFGEERGGLWGSLMCHFTNIPAAPQTIQACWCDYSRRQRQRIFPKLVPHAKIEPSSFGIISMLRWNEFCQDNGWLRLEIWRSVQRPLAL